QPSLVAEVSFSEWTPDSRIRHSVFHGLRDDKPASVITKETPAPAQAVAKPPKPAGVSKEAKQPALPALPKDLRISHPERVIDTTTGLTKQDLVNYYLLASKRILPHLQKRPA